MNAKLMKPETLTDRLGSLQDKINKLQEDESNLKELLKATGLDEVQGKSYRAVVSRSEIERVDYKAICEALKPKPALVAFHTTVQERVALRVTKIQGETPKRAPGLPATRK